MMHIAVFPGQGSQRKNMGLDFAKQFPLAQETFTEASDSLGFDMETLVGSEDEGSLNLTANAQPAILTAEIAMYRSLRDRYGYDPVVFGGHSLGEYAALVAAGVIPFGVAVRMVRLRGQLMQEASPLGVGSMAAVIGDDLPLGEIEAVSGHHGIDIANDNSPTQVVLSGEKNALDRVLGALGALVRGEPLRLVPLEVSAPFHSRHMAAIETRFRDFALSVSHTFDATNLSRVTSNVTGAFHGQSIETLIELLTRQISGRVRWRDNMASLLSRAGGVIEIGPGRPLGGFFKGIGVAAASIIDLRSAQRVFEPKGA